MREPAAGIAGVRFRNAGKIFYFHAAGMRLEPGEYVVVETSRGPEVGRVVISPGQVVVNELGHEDLKPILRLATDDDLRRADDLRRRSEELLPEARRLGEELQFPARIDAAEFTLDGRRLTLVVSTEERVDYREFVRRASDQFHARVDVRQVGARDRAKLAGGYGICGRELCCASWLATFPSISIRMAKEQELPLNPQKISGLCGRLLCCLSYEEEGYKEMRKALPRLGQRCSTPTGEGKVIGVNILKRQVTLVVEGTRVDVPDRDLGTVVRWDTSSKIGTPPPSMTRAEGIAQGIIEATEDDLLGVPEDDPWGEAESAQRQATASRGRLPTVSRPEAPQQRQPRLERSQPSGQPHETSPGQPDGAAARRGRRRGGSQRPETPPAPPLPQRPGRPQPSPIPLPEGRRFQRSEAPRPALPRPPQPSPPAGEGTSQRGTGRRGGRQGRRPPPQDAPD